MISLALTRYSLHNLRQRALRSMLTILSVMIGIAAITALVSFGNGISSYVGDIAQKMGNDKLMIQPRGFGFGPALYSNVKLDEEDVKAIEMVNGIEEATGTYVLNGEVESNKQKKYAYIMANDFKEHPKLVEEVYTLKLTEGSQFRGNEKNKVILGYNYRLPDKIFKKPLKLRDNILVNGHEMQIAGFYEEVGNPQDDSNVYITNKAAEDLFKADNFQFILARTSPGQIPTSTAKEVERELRRHRNQKVGNEDFFVQTFEQVIQTFTSILDVITAVVLLIGLISVIVAAVNIMNTMYAAILERTKEIGVMKAIGSRNSYILFLFMLESGILSLVGGILGVLLGYGAASFAGNMISSAGYGFFSPLFSWGLVIASLVFSFLIGILAGLLPAYRASRLQPVDALRYE